MSKTCCFTGHRPQNLPFRFHEQDARCILLKDKLRQLILKKIKEENVTYFISGLALGVDLFAAEIVLELSQKRPGIYLEGVIPCMNQTERWNATQKKRYSGILEKCVLTSVLQETYTPDCMRKRNQYMVDHADCMIAVWNGKPSGTGNTVLYAQQKGIPITVLHPESLRIVQLDEGRGGE